MASSSSPIVIERKRKSQKPPKLASYGNLPTEIQIKILTYARNEGMKLYPWLFFKTYSTRAKAVLYGRIDILLADLPRLLTCVATNQDSNPLSIVKSLIMRDVEGALQPGSDLANYYACKVAIFFTKCYNCNSLRFIIGRNHTTLALDILCNPHNSPSDFLEGLIELEIRSEKKLLNLTKLGNFMESRPKLKNLSIIAKHCYSDKGFTTQQFDHVTHLTLVAGFTHPANLSFLRNFTNLYSLQLDDYLYFRTLDGDTSYIINSLTPMQSVKSKDLKHLKIGISEFWHNLIAFATKKPNQSISTAIAILKSLETLSLAHNCIGEEICVLIGFNVPKLERISFSDFATLTYVDHFTLMMEILADQGRKITFDFGDFDPGLAGISLRFDDNILREQKIATLSGTPKVETMEESWRKPNWPKNLTFKRVGAYEIDSRPQVTFLPNYIFDALKIQKQFLAEEEFCLDTERV